jgi:hypothetical protein
MNGHLVHLSLEIDAKSAPQIDNTMISNTSMYQLSLDEDLNPTTTTTLRGREKGEERERRNNNNNKPLGAPSSKQ